MYKKFENWLRFDKVTESLTVGTFLRHSVDQICAVFYRKHYFENTSTQNVCLPVAAESGNENAGPTRYRMYDKNAILENAVLKYRLENPRTGTLI